MNPAVLNACMWLGKSLLVIAILGGGLQRAYAADTSFGLGYSLQRTDNIQLAPENKQEEWINIATVSYGLQEHSVLLEAGIRGSVAYHDYRHDTSSDESVAGLNASLQWKILPERFTWTVDDYFTQTAIRPLDPATPTNRQDTNVFSTGPDYTIKLSPVNSLQFGARYTDNTFETSDLDSTRNTGNVRWFHVLSPLTTLIFNYGTESVDYKNENLNPNFDRQDAFLQITRQHSRNSFLLEGGTTSIQRDRAEDVNGSRQRFSWMRQMTPTSTLNLSLSSELSDVTRETQVAATTGVSGIPGNIVSNDVFRSKKADLSFTHRRGSGNDVVSLFRHEDDFQASSSDEIRRGGNINVGYEFTAELTAELFAGSSKIENSSTTPSVEYKDTNAGLRLSNRLSSTVSLGFELNRQKRANENSLLTYTENRAMLSLSYASASRMAR